MKRQHLVLILISTLLLFSMQVPVMAASDGDEPLELSINEAVNRALTYSDSLDSAELDTQIARENKAALASGWGSSIITDLNEAAEAEGVYQNLPSLKYQIKAAEKTEDMQEDIVVAETYKAYYDLLQAIEEAAVAEKACQAAESAYNIQDLYLQVGMLSRLDYQGAVLKLANSKADLTEAHNTLENTYIEFNQLVGLDLSDRPVLTDKALYTTLELKNVDSTINYIAQTSPRQWMAEEAVDLKERLTSTPGATDTTELEAEQAEIDADSLYDSTRQALYQIYYSIKGMEESYQVVQENLVLAEKAYNVAQLRFEIGMGTEADVLEAEASLADAQKAVLALTCQHNLMKIAFEKPWCANSVL